MHLTAELIVYLNSLYLVGLTLIASSQHGLGPSQHYTWTNGYELDLICTLGG